MDREAVLWKLQVVAGAVTSSLVTIAMNGLDFFTNENFRKYELQRLKIDSERAQWALEQEELERKRSLICLGRFTSLFRMYKISNEGVHGHIV